MILCITYNYHFYIIKYFNYIGFLCSLGPTSMSDCILIWFRANICKGWTNFLWLRFLDFELLSTYLKGVWRFEKEEGAVDKSVVHSVMCWMPLFIRGRGGAPPSLPLSPAVRAHLPSAHCHSGFYCVRTLSLCLSHWIQYQQSASVCVCVSVSLLPLLLTACRV